MNTKVNVKKDFSLSYGEANLKDREGLKHVGMVSFAQYLPLLSAENSERLSNHLNDDTRLVELIKISKIFVCRDRDKIVGAAYFVPKGNPWDVFKSEWSYLRMVGVDPIYEGQGIGRKLTEMCLAHAKKTNEKTVALHTSEVMHAARHIYESLGFTILEEMQPRLGLRYWLYTLNL